MSNLIITVIAIGLVALLALAGVYYGGSYFSGMTANAQASTFVNAGAQIAGAWSSYRYDKNGTSPTSLQTLVDSGYLLSVPEMPAMAGGVAQVTSPVVNIDTDNSEWLWVTMGRPPAGTIGADSTAAACLKIIKLATSIGVTAPKYTAYGSTGAGDMIAPGSGNDKYGCIQWNGLLTNYSNPLPGYSSGAGAAAGDYVAFYRLQ